jgi:hypothetical protein
MFIKLNLRKTVSRLYTETDRYYNAKSMISSLSINRFFGAARLQVPAALTLFLLLCSCLPIPHYYEASPHLSGRLHKDSRPLEGAEVVLVTHPEVEANSRTIAMTDEDGRFTFDRVRQFHWMVFMDPLMPTWKLSIKHNGGYLVGWYRSPGWFNSPGYKYTGPLEFDCDLAERESAPEGFCTINYADPEYYEKITGLYEYVYEYNTEDLIENHYILLEMENGQISGRYYGTSDDFDDLREGYLPGFYVAPMDDLTIADNRIGFSLSPNEADFHMKPIGRDVTSSAQIDRRENPLWTEDYQPGIRLDRHRLEFQGYVHPKEILIEVPDGFRVFRKKEE